MSQVVSLSKSNFIGLVVGVVGISGTANLLVSQFRNNRPAIEFLSIPLEHTLVGHQNSLLNVT